MGYTMEVEMDNVQWFIAGVQTGILVSAFLYIITGGHKAKKDTTKETT